MSDIALRCFSHSDNRSGYKEKISPNPSLLLVFDTETTTDEYQNLLFGSSLIARNNKVIERYIFYEDNLKESEKEKIIEFGDSHSIKVIPKTRFVEKVFYPYVYQARAKCIGFNLPFDLSRLAIDYTISRKDPRAFSFTLSKDPRNPRVMIRALDSTKSFIKFLRPLRKKSKRKYTHYEGYFVDLRTFAFALTNKRHTLESASKEFKCEHYKTHPERHGAINKDYIEYNLNDVQVTFELYLKLMERKEMFNIDMEENLLYSPASIGKYYLNKMGISPFMELNPDFPKEVLGFAMTTYYGGRTECKIRKSPIPVTYLDFTSMYPTLFILLKLDEILKARSIRVRATKGEVKSFLSKISVESLQDKEVWRDPLMRSIVLIRPDRDILPIRMKYRGDVYNIGINYLTSQRPIWYTIEDVISSKILTGKAPEIIDSLTFEPVGRQSLRAIEINGITIAPEENFIKKIIEKRLEYKDQIKRGIGDIEKLKVIQNEFKIIANASSYGIFIEVNSEKVKDKEITVYGLEEFNTKVGKIESIGKAYNPIIAIFLTSGARLILAIAESIASNNGYYAYMDTDSIFVKPEKVREVKELFEKLNPYSYSVDMFKIEDNEEGIPLDNVLFYGISAKRYCLYRINGEKIEILKESSHGLGHIIGIDPKEVWEDILKMHYHPDSREEIIEKYHHKYAVSQLTVTTPQVLKRFDYLNNNKELAKKIKPFNFVTVGTAYRSENGEPVIPIMPFISPQDKKFELIPYRPFIDYKSGLSSQDLPLDTKEYWKPISKVLEDYFNHHDGKYEGDVGLLNRRQITVDHIKYIGKESNELEKNMIMGIPEYIEYEKMEDFKDFISSLSPKKILEYINAKYPDVKVSLRAIKKLKTNLKRGKYPKRKRKLYPILYQIYKSGVM